MTAPSDFHRRLLSCVAQLAAEGVDALGPLFDLTAHKLVRLAVAITRQQQDAEDAVQAALVRLATQPRLLGAVDAPWAYLLRMVRNESLVILRRRHNLPRLGADLTDLPTCCPVDEVEQEESRRAVWVALRELPTEQAEVVVLKIWEQMTFAQIAEVLEASPNTVASRYQYAITKLSTKLRAKLPVERREVRHD